MYAQMLISTTYMFFQTYKMIETNSDIYPMLKIRNFDSFIFVNGDSSKPPYIPL